MRLLPLVALVLLAACSSPEPSPETPPSDTTAASDPTPTDTTWTTAATEIERGGLDVAILTALHTTTHDGFDRAVFTFDGPVPGYRIAYTDTSAYHCGSGEPVRVDGEGWLEIEFYYAAAHTIDTYESTLEERERALTLPLLREALMTCDFEGYVTWVLGLDEAAPYRVTEQTDPARVVLDFQH